MKLKCAHVFYADLDDMELSLDWKKAINEYNSSALKAEIDPYGLVKVCIEYGKPRALTCARTGRTAKANIEEVLQAVSFRINKGCLNKLRVYQSNRKQWNTDL